MVVGHINEVVVQTGSSDEINTSKVLFGEMKSGCIIGMLVLTRWSYGWVLL